MQGQTRIEVVTSEIVAEGGTSTTSWFIRGTESWIPAANWPEATSESLDTVPGAVHENRVALDAPRGTLLMRVHSRPAFERRSRLAELTMTPKPPHQSVEREYFRVSQGGRLRQERPRTQH